MRQRLLRVDTRVSATACVCMQYRRSLAVCKKKQQSGVSCFLDTDAITGIDITAPAIGGPHF